MAFSFQGIGTTFYGARDFHSDGSYITTEWFVFLAVPIIPVRSLRVIYQGPSENQVPIGIGFKDNYAVLEETSPNQKQVLCVYLFAAFYILWCAGLFAYGARIERVAQNFFSHQTSQYIFAVVFLFSLFVPSVIPPIVRWHGRNKAHA